MRKLAIVVIPLLILALVIGAIACGGEDITPTPTPTATPTATTTATPTPTPTLTPTPTPTPAPSFVLSPLTISPTEAIRGQNVSISTTVTNVGSSGTYHAELLINEAVVDTKDIVVPGGSSQAVTFFVSRSQPGTYNVALGSRRGSFTISYPPLNLTLDYVGVKFDHNASAPGEIYLVVLVDNGGEPYGDIRPPEGVPGWKIEDYSTTWVGERLFTTGSAGNYFKIVIVAYHRPERAPQIWGELGSLAAMISPQLAPLALLGALIDFMNAQVPEYEYVGSYQAMWSDYESWGIGQHNGVGEDDLRLWFRIWSDSPQQVVASPSVGLPDVVIQRVYVPSEVEDGTEVEVGKWYTHSVTLRNNESHQIPVTLKTRSSVTGHLDPESVTMPPNDTKVVDQRIRFEPAGVRTMTYSILYNGRTLDSESVTVTAYERQLSVDFDGWYVGGLRVDTTTKDKTVTARIRLSGWDPGQYTMRIIRDITLWPDESVTQVSFYYDSGLVTKELAFIPPLATGGSTRGYHVALLKDGQVVWSQPSSYPPRLIVSNP